MKFYNYLNESSDDINKFIYDICKPYLNLIKRINNNVFTRSMETATSDFGIKNVRKDRTPKGMGPVVFKKFNRWLQDNNHNRRDKSVSVSAESHELFGDRFYFFPIGKFSYSWIESRDVNMEDNKTGWYAEAPRLYFENPETFDTTYGDALWKPFADYFHTDEGISTAYKNNFEVWFNCNSYYYVSANYYYWDNKNKRIVER